MATVITIAGVDWTKKISEITPSYKENKKTEANIRGGAKIVAPRSSTPGVSLQVVFPYLSKADRDTLYALYAAKAAVVFSSNTDIQSGNYLPVDYAQTLIKTVNTGVILYTVTLALNYDVAPQVPAPVNPGYLASVTTQLGL